MTKSAPAITEEVLRADLTGFSERQRLDGLALVISGGVEPVEGEPGLYKVRSSKGGWYFTSRWDCYCPASGPCKHMAAVRLWMAREQMREAA